MTWDCFLIDRRTFRRKDPSNKSPRIAYWVLRAITGRTLVLLSVSAVLGSGVALLFNSAMRSGLIFEVPDTGGALIVPVVVLMAASGLLASWIPARRALAIRPSEALASE